MMKTHLIAFFCLLRLVFPVSAQVFQVDTIMYHGSPDKFINIVYLGDGYQTNELGNYDNHAFTANQYLFNTSPFSSYKRYFNAFAIRSVSTQSGARHPRTATDCPGEAGHPTLETNNIFGSTFDYGNIHRLLVPTRGTVLNRVLLDNFPLSDQRVIVVNSQYYGGSGGTNATSSVHASSNEIFVHEIGHSYAGLSDEYWAGDQYARETPNLTRETDPNLVKWKNWIGVSGVGVFVHGNSGNQANWYRPHNNCKMRFLGPAFCPVCKERIVQTTLSKFGNPILGFTPQEVDLISQTDSLRFKLDIFQPSDSTLKVKWLVNGQVIDSLKDSVTLVLSQLVPGINNVRAEVLDTTRFIRANNHSTVNTYSVNWRVTRPTTQIAGKSQKPLVTIFPNPAAKSLSISLSSGKSIDQIEVLTTHGRSIYNNRKVRNDLSIDVSGLPSGMYLLKASHSNGSELHRFAKE